VGNFTTNLRKPGILTELVVNIIAHNYAFTDFKQWLTLIFTDRNR